MQDLSRTPPPILVERSGMEVEGGRCSRRCPTAELSGMLQAGSRDHPPPRGQPQPHRRVLCGVLGGVGLGWVVLLLCAPGCLQSGHLRGARS